MEDAIFGFLMIIVTVLCPEAALIAGVVGELVKNENFDGALNQLS